MLRLYVFRRSRSRSSTWEFGTAVAPASRAARSSSTSMCEPEARTGIPRRTGSPIRSVAPDPLSSSTARSQAASSRDTSAPAAATTPPSFERNNRSRVASKTRLGISERDLHDLLHRGRPAPEQVEQPGSGPHDQNGIAGWRLHQTRERKEARPRAPTGRRHAIPPPVPHEIPLLPAPCSLLRLDEHIVVDFPDAVVERLSRPEEGRIERVALVPREVLLGDPVVCGKGVHVRTPFEVMTQLVGERLPGLLAPVEVAEPGEARERAVMEDDPRVQIGPAPAPLERHALTQRVDVAVHRMGERLVADVHCHHPAEVLGRNVLEKALD